MLDNILSQPVSIDTSDVQQTPVSIDTGGYTPPLSSETAAQRASKANYGLQGITDKSYQDLLQTISAGQEDALRTDIAYDIDWQNDTKFRNQLISQLNQPLLSSDQHKAVLNMLKEKKATDPNSVFEEAYAKKYNEAFFKNYDPSQYFQTGSWYADALKEIPEFVKQTKDVADTESMKHQFAITMHENAAEASKRQSWGSYGIGLVEMGFQPAYETIMRQIGGRLGVPFYEGLSGNYKENVAAALLHLPVDQYKPEFLSIMTQLNNINPMFGEDFASYVKDHSSSDVYLDNAFSAMAPLDVFGIVKGTGKFLLKSALRTQTVEAAKSMVKSSAKDVALPPSVAAPTAAGKVGEAAIKKATIDITSDLQGTSNPLRQSAESMMSIFRPDQIVEGGSKAYGQDIVNRLLEQSSSGGKSLLNRMSNIMRVDRTPMLALEDGIKSLKTDMEKEYKGQSNTILNHDIIWDSATNSRFSIMQIGDTTGEPFKHWETAANNARANRWVVEGEAPKGTSTELSYPNFTAYRKAQRELGIKPETMTYKSSVEFAEAKANVVPEIKVDLTPYANFTAFRKAMAEQGIKAKDLPIKNSIDFHNLKTQPQELNRGGFRILPQGEGFYIEYIQPVSETDHPVRDNLVRIKPEKFGLQYGWVNAMIGQYRNPKEVLSISENMQREIATHGPSSLIKMLNEERLPLTKVSRKYWEDFGRVLEAGVRAIDPKTGKPGKMYKNSQEIEDVYNSMIGRIPEKTEIEAMLAFKRTTDIGLALRNLQDAGRKLRWGASQFRFSSLDGLGKKINSNYFEGRLLDGWPGSQEKILIPGTKFGDEATVKANALEALSYKKAWGDDITKGEMKVIELFAPELHPFEGYGKVGKGEYIRFILTNTSEMKPLDWSRVPPNNGSHLLPEYSHYVSQADVRIDGKDARYYGDIRANPVENEAVGRRVAKFYNEVNDLLKEGKIAEAKEHHMKSPFATMDWDKHIAAYNAGKLKIGEPFHVHPRDKLIIDSVPHSALRDRYTKDYNFIDGTRSGSANKIMQLSDLGHPDAHDMYTFRDVGSRSNPVFNYEPAKYVDPITAQTRGLSRLANNFFMDDMKLNSYLHWLDQAKDWLKNDLTEIHNNPFSVFHNGEFKSNTPMKLRRQLEAARAHIKAFQGATSTLESNIMHFKQNLMDDIYEKGGRRAALVPNYLLGKIRNPIPFVRSMAFKVQEGFFAPSSFVTNFMTWTHIASLAPSHTIAGMYATKMHAWAKWNNTPEILNYLDKKAVKFGWKEGHMLEAMKHGEASGYFNVGSEHALSTGTPQSLKNPMPLAFPNSVRMAPGMIKDGGKAFINAGDWFFKAGAASTRVGSWYVAYKEWIEGSSNIFKWKPHPNANPSRSDLEEIFARASDLDANMSRSSSSPVHTGAMSIPGMFYVYNLRLAEEFTGKRLTPMEKLRMFTFNSLLYGVPGGGLGLMFFPLGDYVRKAMIAGQADIGPVTIPLGHGYVLGENPLMDVLMNGWPAYVTAMISGGGDAAKGSWYNFSKFGPGKLDPVQHLLDRDQTWLEIMGGAPGSTIAGLWSSTSGLRAVVMSGLREENKAVKLTPDIMLNIFKEIKAFRQAWQVGAAITYGQWLNKNEQYIEDVNSYDAIARSLSGMTSIQASDIYLMRGIDREEKEKAKYYEKQATTEFVRFLRATHDKDPTNGQTALNNAFAWLEYGNFPSELKARVLAKATEEAQIPAIDNAAFNLYLKDVPEDLKPGRLEAYQQMLKLKGQ